MHRYLLSITLIVVLIASSCGGDGDGDDAPMQVVSLTVADLTTTVPNQSPTGFIIGQVEASASDGSNLSYELVSESVPGALSVGTTTGRILVADGSLFDRDHSDVINATIEVTSGDVVSAASVSINIDELTEFQIQTVAYFKDIALGFEFGNASQVTRKWREKMRVYVAGSPTEALTEELDMIIGELRELITDGFEIELVDSQQESNYVVFFGSADQYVSMFPSAANSAPSNWGLFFVNWDTEQYLNSGHMYVDTERANAVEQRHLLREEFTQSLGLARDSEQYPGSIFQSVWTRTTTYTDLDRELIRLLYHPRIISGMGASLVETRLREILTSD